MKYIIVFGVDDCGKELIWNSSRSVEVFDTLKDFQDRILFLSDWHGYPFYGVTYSPSSHPGGSGYIVNLTKYTWSFSQSKFTANRLNTASFKSREFRQNLDKVYYDFQKFTHTSGVKATGSKTKTGTIWEGDAGESRVAQLVFMAFEDFSIIRDKENEENPGFLDVDIRSGPFGVMLSFSSEGKESTNKRSIFISMNDIENTLLPPNKFYAIEIWPIVEDLMKGVVVDRTYSVLKSSFLNWHGRAKSEETNTCRPSLPRGNYILGVWDDEHHRYWYLENQSLMTSSELIWTANRDRAPVYTEMQKSNYAEVVKYINEVRAKDEDILCWYETSTLHFIPTNCICPRCVESKKNENSVLHGLDTAYGLSLRG